VILACRFQLARLSEHTDWFIDGTFWSAPKGFYQMLNIIVFSQELNKHICLVHILMTSKKSEEYQFALNNLVLAAKLLNIQLKPKFFNV